MLALSLTACGGSKQAGGDAIVFNDQVLEQKVREIMGKPNGDITVADAEAVTELDASVEWQQHIPEETQIKDIGALRYFKNLKRLTLTFNRITDITPLAGLTQLELLDVGANQISDISAVSEMKGLTSLKIFGNLITDISPLAGLVNLENLHADRNQFPDLSPLAGLSKLNAIDLSDSVITDITPLAGLTNLTFLDLARNGITDISALSGLVNLKSLMLEGNQIGDFNPIKSIYPNLTEKDFEIN